MGDTLEVFFVGKYFKIPNYQRDYAWDIENVDDLIDDVIEAIETNTSHYIGTFILAETDQKEIFHVVDGQQRLTTLTMIIDIAIKIFGSEHDKIIFGDKFIRQPGGDHWRLELLNSNNQFFQALLEGQELSVETKGQERLKEAYNRIRLRIEGLLHKPQIASQFLGAIKQLEVLQFIESDDGKAIRMFQTVNDRGRALANIEKAKSLLIYYSNRFLQGKRDEMINDQFADIFHKYAAIKSIGEDYAIDVINSRRFSEDSVMRYHFLAYADQHYDFDATENYVLDIYLKQCLKDLRNDQENLEKFILDYVFDLNNFFASFVNILERVKDDIRYFKLFVNLGVSTRLYPLIIRMETRGLLEEAVTLGGSDIFEMVEVADVRVYKIRGTDPRSDVSYLARNAKYWSVQGIAKELNRFIDDFMHDGEFRRRLRLDVFPNPVLRHLFTEYGEHQRKKKFALEELMALNKKQPSVEHIFPKVETFPFPDYGFDSLEEYNELMNKLGNLTLLEKSINSKCRNKTPAEKIEAPDLYSASDFENARHLSARYKGEGLSKDDINDRTDELIDFCMEHWPYH